MDTSNKISLTRRRLYSHHSVHWRGALIISIPVVCLLASIFAIAFLRSKTLAIHQEEQQSQQTISQTKDLLTVLVNAETGVRGYVITRRLEFLKPYTQAKAVFPELLESLKNRVKTNPNSAAQFAQIQERSQQQIVLLEQIFQTSSRLEATTNSSVNLTQQLLESKLNMDQLRRELSEFYQQEKNWQRDRQLQALWWGRLTTIVQWSCLGGGLLASVTAVYLFNQLDRELAQQASRLAESNVHLRTIFNSVVDGIIILDERGYIQAVNAAASEIFAYPPGNLPGLHLQRLMAELFTEDSGQAMRSLVGKNQDKLRLQQETIARRQDGTTFPMEFAISEMQVDSERLFIAIVRDITERKQSQETLFKQAQLLNLANDTIIVRDLNDTITYWNQGAQKLYGYLSTEAVGQSIHALLKTEFPQPAEQIKAILFQQGYWSGELVHSRKDGTRVFVKSGWTLYRDETGEPVAYLEINQDITERKQAEAALRKSEKLYRTLVKNFPNGAVFLFDKQLRYTIAEGTGLGTVNLTSETLTGKTIWETLPPETAELLAPIYREALQGKSTVMEIPFADRFYYVQILPVTNEKGEIWLGMTMTQDITERKLAEDALRSRADELARLTAALGQTTANLEKRNSELDQFAYIVSHDLKAPLRGISNLAQWLEEDLKEYLTNDTRHQINLLQRRVHRMEALINGILQYSRSCRVRTEWELVDVEELLAEVIDSLAPPPEFTITIMPGMPTLWTERLPLEQVFANLIGNAIKHHHQKDGKIEIFSQEKLDCYEFEVTDNGPGIPHEFHEKIFVMFQTLKPRDTLESTGIGLAIVKKIIEGQGGTISLKSDVGQGATFRFTWLKKPIL